MLTRFRNWLAHQLAQTAVALASDDYKEVAHRVQPVTLELDRVGPQLALMPAGWEIDAEGVDMGPPLCSQHGIEMTLAIRDRAPVGPPAPYYFCRICTGDAA